MPSDHSVWYAIGRALGSVMSALPDPPARGREEKARRPVETLGSAAAGSSYAMLAASGVAAMVAAMLATGLPSRRPTKLRLVRGALAGGGAAALVLAVRELALRSQDDQRQPPDVLTEVLGGAGRGLLYVSLIDPWLPGPPVLKGAIAGTADYIAAPLGGLFRRLQPLSPIQRVPMISTLLDVGSSEGEPYLTYVCNGALLGLLCGRANGALKDGPGAES